MTDVLTIPVDPDALLTKSQVAALLNVTPRWVKDNTGRGACVPHVPLGERTIRYRRGVVLRWVAELEQNGGFASRKHHPRVAA
jgi:hypothetical protein